METFDIVPESPVDKPYVEANYNGTLLLAESDYRIGSNPVNSIKCTTVVKKVVNEYTNIRVILPGNIAVTAEKIGINLVDIENKKVATIVAPIKANHLAIKTEDIYNCWITIIGAITPSLLQNKLTQDAVGGGLISRIIFVVGHGPKQRKALQFLTDEEADIQEKLETDLQEIANI